MGKELEGGDKDGTGDAMPGLEWARWWNEEKHHGAFAVDAPSEPLSGKKTRIALNRIRWRR